MLLITAGIAALLGLALLGGLAPFRSRQVRRRLTAGTGVAAPQLLAWVTGALVLVAVAAAVSVLMQR